MRAAVRDRYGPPDVVEVGEVDKPALLDDGVLVRVHAASLNRADWYQLLGQPLFGRFQQGLRRPKTRQIGIDFAGTVEAVGKDVTHVGPGDEVFGARNGAVAEYVCVRVGVVPKPPNVSFEQAAAVPVAGLTALQGLRDKGGLQAGQKVLINGASGGVGTFAVQVAKALGAEVTAVCSTRNLDQARSLGADHVIDYTKDDFTRSGELYDLLFDAAGSKSLAENRRILKPDGTFVLAGVPLSTGVIGPLGHVAKVKLGGIRASQKVVFFISKVNRPDVEFLAGLLASGQLTPVVERTYELSEIREALRYLGEGHARGKIVVTL